MPRASYGGVKRRPSLARLKQWLVEETGGDPQGGKRTFRDRFLHMIGRHDPPELVAASFALGIFIAFTPLFGLHLAMAIVLALMLKLNKIDVILGTLVMNPLTIPPASALAIPLGREILQADRHALTALPWDEFFKPSFWSQAGPTMRAVGVQWAVGMFALAFIFGAITYVVLVRFIYAHRARRAVAAAEERAAAVSPESPPAPLSDTGPR
jgi:uncharacterized protein